MYNENYKIFISAGDIPAEWDGLSINNPYMRREFLSFLETEIPCEQKYYIFYGSTGFPDTVFVTYHDKTFDLGMLTAKRRIVDMTMVYMPVWVKRPGIIFGRERFDDALKYIKKIKGYKFINCIPAHIKIKSGYTKAAAAPACTLEIKWKTFEQYMSALRSNYRYRYNKALKKSDGLKMAPLADNAEFSEELYSLYEQVENNAKIKIDKLPISFFKSNLFKILVFYKDNAPAGFIQLLENGDELIFEFVGFDYKINAECHIYHRMLLEIIRYGIERGFKYIDFGQTADDTKLKLGCHYEYLKVYLHHSNPFINLAYRVIAPFIDYRPLKPDFNVFKT